jgi:hypothetical protein
MKINTVLPRILVLAAAVGLAGVAVRCSSGSAGKPLRRSKQRVFVMGFDGMDPTLTRQLMAAGSCRT